jgi:hypothetical protein
MTKRKSKGAYMLSRLAGVSGAGVPGTRAFRVTGWGAGARWRNPDPERSEGGENL